MNKIDKTAVNYFNYYQVDDVGRIFEYKRRIFREIYPEKKQHVMKLFESGLLKELIELGAFPKTWITEYYVEEGGIIVEHEKLDFAAKPEEWSDDMLRDAAVLCLQIEKICRKYGYTLKDKHPGNIIFSGCRLYFIDLGSFVENTRYGVRWQAKGEFCNSFYLGVRLCEQKAYGLAAAILTEKMPERDLNILQKKKYKNFTIFQKLERKWNRFQALVHEVEPALECVRGGGKT